MIDIQDENKENKIFSASTFKLKLTENQIEKFKEKKMEKGQRTFYSDLFYHVQKSVKLVKGVKIVAPGVYTQECEQIFNALVKFFKYENQDVNEEIAFCNKIFKQALDELIELGLTSIEVNGKTTQVNRNE